MHRPITGTQDCNSCPMTADIGFRPADSAALNWKLMDGWMDTV